MGESTYEFPQTDLGGKIVYTTSILSFLLDRPTQNQPVGRDVKQWRRVTALQVEGFSIAWTPYRPADLTGARPVWYQFAVNVGDVDTTPVGIPMGPRHFSIDAIPIGT
jgi:hypothetical protein